MQKNLKGRRLWVLCVFGYLAIFVVKSLFQEAQAFHYFIFILPDISGIEFTGVFPKMPYGNFTIAYSEYAVKGFELDGVDYLLKPFSSASTGSCYAFIINFMKFGVKLSTTP